MIYKIIDNPDVLAGGCAHLSSCNIYFVKGCLFVSDKNNKCNMQTLRDIFKTSNILEITEHNLMLEPSHVIEWAKKEFVQEDFR